MSRFFALGFLPRQALQPILNKEEGKFKANPLRLPLVKWEREALLPPLTKGVGGFYGYFLVELDCHVAQALLYISCFRQCIT